MNFTELFINSTVIFSEGKDAKANSLAETSSTSGQELNGFNRYIENEKNSASHAVII